MKKPHLILVLVPAAAICAGLVFQFAHPAKQWETATAPKTALQLAPSGPAAFANLPGNANYTQYAEHIHALGPNVPQQEQKAITDWINNPKPSHILDKQWYYLVNEVMNSLCGQNKPLPDLSDILINLARKKTNNIVLRDYAIQHFVDWLQPRRLQAPHEANPEKRAALLATMIEAAGQPRESYSGTALQCLNLLLIERQISARQNPSVASQLPLDFSPEQLHPLAVNLATGKDTNDLARLTALQVSAQRGYSEILPTARAIAGDPAQPASLRLSAIAAIGQLGNAQEDDWLFIQLEAENNRQFRAAVKASQKALQQREAATITAKR